MEVQQVFSFMKDQTKKTLSSTLMEEVIVETILFKEHWKIVIKEVLENLDQLIIYHLLMGTKEEYSQQLRKEILYFMIGVKLQWHIAMEQNIQEVDLIQFHTKIEFYILEVRIILYNCFIICNKTTNFIMVKKQL